MSKRNFYIGVYLALATFSLFIFTSKFVFIYDLESPRMQSDSKDLFLYGVISIFITAVIYFIWRGLDFEKKLKGKILIIYGFLMILFALGFSLYSKINMEVILEIEKHQSCWIPNIFDEEWEIIGDRAFLNSPYKGFGLVIIIICLFFIFNGLYLILVKTNSVRKLWKDRWVHVLLLPILLIISFLTIERLVYKDNFDRINSFASQNVEKGNRIRPLDRSE
jgi:hypothetical protein